MVRDLWLFARSLWRHWQWLLSGIVGAAVTAYSLITGNTATRDVGLTIIVGSFIAACFLAWRAEFRRANGAEALVDVIDPDRPRVRITSVRPPGDPEKGRELWFTVHFFVENPGDEMFIKNASLSIRWSNGGEQTIPCLSFHPTSRGRFAMGDNRHVSAVFRPEESPSPDALHAASYELLLKTSRGDVTATFPRPRALARANDP
jgi:hypothetical protein